MSWGGRGRGRGGNQPRYSASKDQGKKHEKKQQSFELKFDHQSIALEQINIDSPTEFQISVGSGFSAKKIVHKILNGKDVVIKALDLSNPRIWEELQREVKVFETTSRYGTSSTDPLIVEGKKHILSYYGVATDSSTSTGFIVLEKADNNLLNILKLHTEMIDNSTELIPNKFWVQCAADIASGMHFIHGANIYHRDLQMENCLLFLDDNPERPSIKVSDFGGSLFHSDPPISFCGNRRLTAPEVLKQRMDKQPLSSYSTSSDVYMFGCLLYEIAEGWRGTFRLFPETQDPQAFNFILAGKRPSFSTKRASRIRPEFAELIQKCWDQDPQKRPSFAEVYQILMKILASVETTSSSENNNNSTPSSSQSANSPLPHTIHLYLADEVSSALEKSIRRSQTQDALYWTSELFHSNLAHLAWDKIINALSEDISIASPHCILAVRDAHHSFKQKNDPIFLFQAAHMVATAPKNRIVMYSLLNVMRQVEDLLKDAEDGNGGTLASVLPPQGTKLPANWTLMDLYFILLYNISQPKFSELVIDFIQSFTNKISEFAHALCQMESTANSEESSVLKLFHAAKLAEYTQLLHGAPLPVPAKSLFQQYLKPVAGLKGRHPQGIPACAIDRSTARGAPCRRDTVFGYSLNTMPLLEQASKEQQVNISEWGKEEISKSHGPAKIRFLNQKLGSPTFISDEVTLGWWIPESREVSTILKNHQIDIKAIKEFLLQWEEAYGCESSSIEAIMRIQAKRIASVFS